MSMALLMFHKPKGVVVTRSDELGRRTVYDLLPPWVRDHGWQAIGRLDKDTRGLLLFTDDGKQQEQLSRPGSVAKVYEVWVRGQVSDAHIAKLLAGVTTPIGTMSAHAVERKGGGGHKSRLLVTLKEGQNRQIRRMFAALKDEQTGSFLKVTDLKRISIGVLNLDVQSGQWRALTEAEEAALL